VFSAQKKNPHEMGLARGNVKIRRKLRRPQALEEWLAALDAFRNWLIRAAA
jgi:hypothetical protein